MSDADADDRAAEVARWFMIADQDIAAARICLEGNLPAIAAYHCQQAIEKIAKGLLVTVAVPFPKTHDLAALGSLVGPHFPALAPAFAALAPVTVWGAAYRYPPEEEAAAAPPPADVAARLREIHQLRALASVATKMSATREAP